MISILIGGVQHHVEFPNRCFFCFVQVSSDSNALSYDTSRQVHFPVQWFQEAFNHLVPEPDKNSIAFGRSPPICSDCGTLLEVLHGALTQLASVTIAVNSRINNLGNDASNKEQQLHDFLRDFEKTSSGRSGSHQETLNILEKIGHGPFPRLMNMFQECDSQDSQNNKNSAFPDECQDGEVYEWNPDAFNSEPKPGRSHGEGSESKKVFVEDLEKKEAGFETEVEFDSGEEEDEEFFDEDVDMEEEPIPATKLECPQEQDPLTDSGFSKKVLVPKEKVAGDLKTVKEKRNKLDHGKVIMGHSTQICDFCCQSVNLVDISKHVRDHVGDFALPCPNPVCPCVFSNISQLSRHARLRPTCGQFMTEDISICKVCGHKATNLQSLRGHLLIVHEAAETEKPHPCPVAGCLHRFTHRQTVQCHIVLHTWSGKDQSKSAAYKQAPPSLQACPTCEAHVPLDEIRGHLEKVHGALPESIVSCNYCPYLFPSRDKMIDHWVFHITSGIPVSCDVCCDDKKFMSSRALRDHYWAKHQIGSSRVVCEHCNKSFTGRSHLRKHIKITHLGEKKIYHKFKVKCGECHPEQEFRTEKYLMNHKIKFHGADPFKCQFCGKEFQVFLHLSRHENEHKGVSKKVKVWPCDVAGCGKTFKQKHILERHKRSAEHVGITNEFICGQCGKGFNHEDWLKKHEEGVHRSERKFVCEECGESFKSANVLKTHKMIHTGEKPFECDICHQKFRHKDVLKRHVKGHEKKGAAFKPNGPMKNLRKRVNPK